MVTEAEMYKQKYFDGIVVLNFMWRKTKATENECIIEK
jgi:hypothetical protein